MNLNMDQVLLIYLLAVARPLLMITAFELWHAMCCTLESIFD